MAPPVRPDPSTHYDHTAQVCFDQALTAEDQVTDESAISTTEENTFPPSDYHDDAVKLKKIEQPRQQSQPDPKADANSKLMTDPSDQISDPARKLPRLVQVLADRHRWMDKLAKDFDADTNVVVRTTSDWVSGAGERREAFQENLQGASTALINADAALEQGNWNEAYSSLQSAETHLDGASDSWSDYIDGTSSGARSITHGLRVVRNSSAAFVGAGVTALTFGAGAVVAGAFATSAGAHAGLSSIPFGAEQEPLAPEAPQQNVAEPKPKDDVLKEEPVAEKPGICIPPDQRTAKSADYKGEGCNPEAVDSAKLKLERRIQWAVRERAIDPKTVKKDTAVLVAEARQALTEWKQDPSVAHKYGDFFLQTETPDKMDQSRLGHLAELRKQWEGDAASYRTAVAEAEPGNGAKAVMGRLFYDYLTLYVRKNANMSDVLDGRGGNCEAQTKLITAGMTAGEVQIPPGERLAVQLFEDHIQAVVYNEESGTVHNLLTGEKTTDMRAPLYNPHIFHHAYLESRGETSPVSVQDLLIADASGEHVQDGWHPPFSTNSKLNYPGGKGYYNSGPIPEVAYVGQPSDIRGSIREFGERFSDDRALSKDEVPSYKKGYTARFEHDSHGVGFMSVYQLGIVFKTEEQATFYNSLPDTESKRNFLITLTNQKVAAMLEKPEIQRGLALLSNPYSLKKQNGKTVERAIAAMDSVKSTIEHTARIIGERLPILGTEGAIYGDKTDAAQLQIQATLDEKSPLLRIMHDKKSGLRERVMRHPLEFVLFMDRLPHQQRDAFMGMVDYTDRGDLAYKERPYDKTAKHRLRKTIADRKLIGVGEKPGYEPQIIHITLVDVKDLPKFDPREKKPEEGAMALKNEEGQQGREKRKDELVDETNAPYRVKAESMIDFALKYAPERWNHALAREFRQLNRDGRYDQNFLNHYHSLNNSYPESQQRFEIPYEKYENLHDFTDINLLRMMEGMMREGKENEKVAYDIHLILKDIMRRRQQSNVGAR